MWCLRFVMESINRVAPTYRPGIASHGENLFLFLPALVTRFWGPQRVKPPLIDENVSRCDLWSVPDSSRSLYLGLYYFYTIIIILSLFIIPLKSHGPLEANIFSQIASQVDTVDTWERWGLSLLDSCSPLIATKKTWWLISSFGDSKPQKERKDIHQYSSLMHHYFGIWLVYVAVKKKQIFVNHCFVSPSLPCGPGEQHPDFVDGPIPPSYWPQVSNQRLIMGIELSAKILGIKLSTKLLQIRLSTKILATDWSDQEVINSAALRKMNPLSLLLANAFRKSCWTQFLRAISWAKWAMHFLRIRFHY